MYLTSIKFYRALEWFLHSKYDYLLIYVSGASRLDYKISNEVLTNRQLIDAQTGHLVCFLHFIENGNRQDSIIRAVHSDSVEDFMIYHINTEEAKLLTRRDLYHGVGLEATYETTRDLCEFFDIKQYKLPAFILINKNNENKDISSLAHQFSLFSIKSTDDLHSLLEPIKIINNYQVDINSVNSKLAETRKIPDANYVQQEIESISKEIEILKRENNDELSQQKNQIIRDIQIILQNDDIQIPPEEMSMDSLRAALKKAGIIQEFMTQHNAIISKFNSIDKQINKWKNDKKDELGRLMIILKEKKDLLVLSNNRDEKIRQLTQEKNNINHYYTEQLEKVLLVNDASELLTAVNEQSSALPLILQKLIKTSVDFNDNSTSNNKTIKCFIAGSIVLQNERDALRAAISSIHNRWNSRRISIQAFTFEDFDEKFVSGGQQREYNQFIEEDANWVFIIIDGNVGGITLEEYRVAMDAFKKNGRPNILALAKVGSEDTPETALIKKEINNEHQYWTDYTDIEHLKLQIKNILNNYLIRLFAN